jgi:hypothetical protein
MADEAIFLVASFAVNKEPEPSIEFSAMFSAISIKRFSATIPGVRIALSAAFNISSE